MKWRILKITWSILSIGSCLLIVGLWLRSYRTIDGVTVPMTSSWSLELVSVKGLIGIGKSSTASSWSTMQMSFDEWQTLMILAGVQFPSSTWGGMVHEKNSTGLCVPYWMLLIVAGALAIAPWAGWRWRFSLRAMLIVMTLSALALGLLIYAAQQ